MPWSIDLARPLARRVRQPRAHARRRCAGRRRAGGARAKAPPPAARGAREPRTGHGERTGGSDAGHRARPRSRLKRAGAPRRRDASARELDSAAREDAPRRRWRAARAAVAPPPPPPQAPPLPFTYVGMLASRTRRTVVFLAQGDRNLRRAEGRRDQRHLPRRRVAEAGRVVLTYLPLDQRQTLTVGGPNDACQRPLHARACSRAVAGCAPRPLLRQRPTHAHREGRADGRPGEARAGGEGQPAQRELPRGAYMRERDAVCVGFRAPGRCGALMAGDLDLAEAQLQGGLRIDPTA